MSEPLVDQRFYQCVRPNSAAERVLIKARDRIYSDFIKMCNPTSSDVVLDVGVSDVINEGANFFERKYPFLENVTACGLGDAVAFRREYPLVTYVQIEPNTRLPFPDKRFDIVTANAVLEHVGGKAEQKSFIRELARVGRQVFITVPNRYFPFEHHTSLPFFHWSDTLFWLACGITGKDEWALPQNLVLMSRTTLLQAAAEISSRKWSAGHTGIPLGPFSSNLYLHSRTF